MSLLNQGYILKKLGDYHLNCQEFVKNYLDSTFNNNDKVYYLDIVELLENRILNDLPNIINVQANEKNIKKDKKNIEFGLAFPTTICVNEIVAHNSPKLNDKRFFTKDDLVKIDFGFQYNGYIIDSAFSYSQNSFCDQIINVSKEACEIGLKMCKIDQNIFEIGEKIEECIKNAEVCDEKEKLYPLKSIYDVCGHSIGKKQLHAGQFIPNISLPCEIRDKIRPDLRRIQSGFSYAIEPYPTTGSNLVEVDKNVSFQEYNFMYNYLYQPKEPLKQILKIPELNFLWKKYETYCFSQRQIFKDCIRENQPIGNIYKALKDEQNQKIWNIYPPLINISNKDQICSIFVAQTERNVWIDPILETSVILT